MEVDVLWQPLFSSRRASRRRVPCAVVSVTACRRIKPLTKTGGSMSAVSTASVSTLIKNSWQPKIFTAKPMALTSISMCSHFCRGKFSLTKKLTASVWNLPGIPFKDMRSWLPRIWTLTMTAAFREYTTILLSIRSALRTAGRFTSRRTPCRNCGRSAMTSAVTTVCLCCLRRSAETVRASVRGSTMQR